MLLPVIDRVGAVVGLSDAARMIPGRETTEDMGRVDVGPDGGEFVDVKSETVITDWDDVFRRFNLDPDAFTIVDDTVRISNWQQSRRLENGDRDVVDLFSYRARFIRKADAIDLPALYAEVARTKRPKPLKVGRAVTLVVCWADVQAGKVDRLGGVPELLARLEEKRAELEQHIRRVKPNHIVIADVGDIVEGIENTSSQLATNGLAFTDQVDVAATEFWKAIRLCAKYARTDVLSIPSNHAQLRRGKGLIGKPTDDWGLHISKRLQAMNAEVGLPVTFHRPADWEETLTFDVRGTRLGLAHGHQASNPNAVVTWWAKMTHAGVMDCDVLLTGHFHFASVRPSGRSPVTGRSRWHIQAPTIDNGSAWVRNQFGEDGDPALMVFEIDSDGFALKGLAAL